MLSFPYFLGVVPTTSGRVSTQLKGFLPVEQMTTDQLKIKDIQEKWAEIRLMDREEAEKTLEGEWLEAYNRFFEKYDDDMTRMTEIAEKVQKMIEPAQAEKKTKGQRKRDLYAKTLAREAARAAAPLK